MYSTTEYLFKLYIHSLSKWWLEEPLTPRKKSRNKNSSRLKEAESRVWPPHKTMEKSLAFFFGHAFLLICKKTQAKGKNYCICYSTLKKFCLNVKLNASIGQQTWFQLCKFMEVYSGSHKTTQLNLWQIYSNFFPFKVHSYENISPVRHVYEFGIFLRWNSALHFKFAQIVFTTVFCVCFQRVNIPWAEHYTLDPVKCYSTFACWNLACYNTLE